MESVGVDGAEVHYEVHGAGEPVVLVHSTGGSAIQWAAIAPALADRWAVAVPELSGTASCVDDGRPLTVDDLVAQVRAVADDAGFDRFHVAGYSLGAAVAMALAAAEPAQVASLVSLLGWSRSTPELAHRFDLWSRLFRADRELFARYFLTTAGTETWLAAHAEGLDQVSALLAAAVAPGTDRHAELDAVLDIDDRLGAIVAPTMVVGGTQDRILPIALSRQLAAAIAGAELVEVEANHNFVGEQPAEVAALLARHFAAHPTS